MKTQEFQESQEFAFKNLKNLLLLLNSGKLRYDGTKEALQIPSETPEIVHWDTSTRVQSALAREDGGEQRGAH